LSATAQASWSTSVVDEAQMLALGARLAAVLSPGLVIYLVGDLGMGKTTLTRGVVQALGHRGAVKSPTYTLVEPYAIAGQTVYHFDLYRLHDPEELEFMGIRDYFTDSSLALIEWPQRGQGFLPSADLAVRIEREAQHRCVLIEAKSVRGLHCLRRLTDLPVITGDSGV